MRRYILKAVILLSFLYISCDNANDLLDQHLKDGPIVYAAKINEMTTQSGYYRFRVNIYPAEDVNLSHCMLTWNLTGENRDSVRIDYEGSNFDEELGCYYTHIDISPNDEVQGNLEISAQNADTFGNRSLIEVGSTYIYGETYVSTLLNLPVRFSDAGDVLFENRMGVVGHVISYEQNNGQFTEDIVVNEDYYPLIDAKVGGTIRTKTRYLITETDIDTLVATEYLETVIEDDDIDLVLATLLANTAWETTQVAPGITWKYYHFTDMFGSKQYVTLFDIDLNDANVTVDIPYVTSGFKRTSVFATENNANIAFNGSYFNTSTGGSSVYFKYDGAIINQTSSSLPSYRDNGAFVLTNTGKAKIVQRPSGGWSTLAAEYILSGGPLLVVGGQRIPLVNDDHNMLRHPRTVIGMTHDNRLIAVVVDGRNSQSAGMRATELTELMLALGCRSAVNLDGGGSSTAWVKGEGVVNHPTDNGIFDHQGERGVATVFTVTAQ